MVNYSKGKIYKIVVDTDEEYKPYVGSTVESLSRRMGGHRSDYKKWKKGGKNCMSFGLFEKYGVEKCKIILLEEYPCDSKMKLFQKEREWFDKIECCNQRKPITSKEERVEYLKEYREQHKEQILEFNKEYYEQHKEKILEYHKEYYEQHKEQIAEKAKEKYDCPCGSTICKHHKTRHERSLKHQNYLSSLKV